MAIPTEPIGSIPRPFSEDDRQRIGVHTRDTAFAKIRARVAGTTLAARTLGAA